MSDFMYSGYKVPIEDGVFIEMRTTSIPNWILLSLPQEDYLKNLDYEITVEQAKRLVFCLTSIIDKSEHMR